MLWLWAIPEIRVHSISQFYSNRENRKNLMHAKYRWIQAPLTCLQSSHSHFSGRELTFTFAAIACLSVCLSVICLSVVCLYSVTFVHPTQPVKIFSNVSSPFGTLAIHWHPRKFFTEIVSGVPFRLGGLNAIEVAKYTDFGAFISHILETVQDWR